MKETIGKIQKTEENYDSLKDKLEKKFEFSEWAYEASKITLDRIPTPDELKELLEAGSEEEFDKKFKEATRKYWDNIAVSAVVGFKDGKKYLKHHSDLDGESALYILKLAGIDTSNVAYIQPGEYIEGGINFDTGNKYGVVYDKKTKTAFFDHHIRGTKPPTSTAAIAYKTMKDLGLLEQREELDRFVDFVTKMDNRQFSHKNFLKGGKTILGLHKNLTFKQLLSYFKEQRSAEEELSKEDLEKYGLIEAAKKQQQWIDEAMKTLNLLEKEGKIIDTKYGKIVINENRLKRGSASAASYVKYDGVINITPGKSFAVTLRDKNFNEEELRKKLGNKFQGAIVHKKIWIHTRKEPIKLTLDDIIEAIS